MFDDLLQGQPSMFVSVVNNVFSDPISTVFAKKDTIGRRAAGFNCRRRAENLHG
jgi:hypothetical protein